MAYINTLGYANARFLWCLNESSKVLIFVLLYMSLCSVADQLMRIPVQGWPRRDSKTKIKSEAFIHLFHKGNIFVRAKQQTLPELYYQKTSTVAQKSYVSLAGMGQMWLEMIFTPFFFVSSVRLPGPPTTTNNSTKYGGVYEQPPYSSAAICIEQIPHLSKLVEAAGL